jgi:hypothetical protein
MRWRKITLRKSLRALRQINQKMALHSQIGILLGFCGKFRTKVVRYASSAIIAKIYINLKSV